MARSFNGTSDNISATLNISSFSLISIFFRLWWNAYANDDDYALGHNAPFTSNRGFYVDPNSSAPSNGLFAFGFSTGALLWLDNFVRPSVGQWHTYVLVMNRATPQNLAWVDAASATIGTGVHQAGTYGNFADATMTIMSQGNTTRWGAGKMEDLAVWGGVQLSQAEISALHAGVRPNLIQPLSLVDYWPVDGAGSPEPDTFAGNSGTVTGTTLVDNAAVGVPAPRLAVAA